MSIRPLNLSNEQMTDMVVFMRALTSPEFENVKESE